MTFKETVFKPISKGVTPGKLEIFDKIQLSQVIFINKLFPSAKFRSYPMQNAAGNYYAIENNKVFLLTSSMLTAGFVASGGGNNLINVQYDMNGVDIVYLHYLCSPGITAFYTDTHDYPFPIILMPGTSLRSGNSGGFTFNSYALLSGWEISLTDWNNYLNQP